MAASMSCSAPTRSERSICARRHRERLTVTLAPVGPQAPPAPSARRALDGARERRGALLWTTGTSCVGANPSTMSPNTCPLSLRPLHIAGEGAKRSEAGEGDGAHPLLSPHVLLLKGAPPGGVDGVLALLESG